MNMTQTSQIVGTPVLRFAAGLPGFAGVHRFALVEVFGPESPFALLRSIEDPDLAFVVTHPTPFFPTYAVDLDDAAADQLKLGGSDDAIVLLIVTLGDTLEASTANMRGPIVVNRTTGEAMQVVLQDDGTTTKTPLLAA
jgi:flagellar assembly factor FliW